MSIKRIFLCAGIAVVFAACSSSPGLNQADSGPPPVVYIGAPGVTITSISVYQGPKCQIVENGVPTSCNVPIVVGRDMLIRVFYSAEQYQVGKAYVARLSISPDTVDEVTGSFRSSNAEADLDTTINFVVPGELVTTDFFFKVELLQEGLFTDDNPTARHPTIGLEQLAVEGAKNTLRLIVAPFAYNYDGSGRVPDVSQQRLDEFRDRFVQLYPLSNAEIAVRQTTEWSSEIGPDGTGWQQVGMRLYQMRGQDNASDDTYYYGIFNPASSLYSFCGGGCLLGVTLLNDQPPDTGTVDYQAALGVGFDEVAADTMVHEIGHAHGRNHAPCGQGLDPNSIDRSFPYAGGGIGVWSWDVVNEVMINPDEWTDIMGYCDDQWISDYHYVLLHNRSQHVNLPWYYIPDKIAYQLITVDGLGNAVIQPDHVQKSTRLSGRAIEVNVYSEQGAASQVGGHYFRWDHLPGGWLFVPEQSFPMMRAEFYVNQQYTIAERPLRL